MLCGASVLVVSGAFERALFEHVEPGGIDLVEAEVEASECGQVVCGCEDFCGTVVEDAVVEIERLKRWEIFAFDDGKESFVADGCADEREPCERAGSVVIRERVTEILCDACAVKRGEAEGFERAESGTDF